MELQATYIFLPLSSTLRIVAKPMMYHLPNIFAQCFPLEFIVDWLRCKKNPNAWDWYTLLLPARGSASLVSEDDRLPKTHAGSATSCWISFLGPCLQVLRITRSACRDVLWKFLLNTNLDAGKQKWTLLWGLRDHMITVELQLVCPSVVWVQIIAGVFCTSTTPRFGVGCLTTASLCALFTHFVCSWCGLYSYST